jgi:tetratricopeptide (TPR) repeat protein
MNNRITEIIQMLKEDPEDPFLMYALALEYHKIKNDLKTEETFDRLLNDFPGYLPTYYQAAHFYWGIGQTEKARSTFLKGISLAENADDLKTKEELRNSYQNFLIDLDET